MTFLFLRMTVSFPIHGIHPMSPSAFFTLFSPIRRSLRVDTSVWTFLSIKKTKCVRPIRFSVCLICCSCSEWEAATLFGSKECFPCLSPSASALEAPSVFKKLSTIVLLHRTAAGVEQTTTGPLTFSPFFNNPTSLVTKVDVGPGHGLRISTSSRANPKLNC